MLTVPPAFRALTWYFRLHLAVAALDAEVVASGQDLSRSVELFDRVNRQDFSVCERTPTIHSE